MGAVPGGGIQSRHTESIKHKTDKTAHSRHKTVDSRPQSTDKKQQTSKDKKREGGILHTVVEARVPKKLQLFVLKFILASL
jgi:hypothetical protein